MSLVTKCSKTGGTILKNSMSGLSSTVVCLVDDSMCCEENGACNFEGRKSVNLSRTAATRLFMPSCMHLCTSWLLIDFVTYLCLYMHTHRFGHVSVHVFLIAPVYLSSWLLLSSPC